MFEMGPGRWARTVAAASKSENAIASRTAPPTSLPMEAPRGGDARRYVGRRAIAYWKRLGPPHPATPPPPVLRSEEHTSELQSLAYLECRLLLEKKKQGHCR